MPEVPEELLAAVNEQAQARVERDIRGYAKYLTPEAIDSLRASFSGLPPRVSRYEIESQEERGSDFMVTLRYFVRDDWFLVQSRWRKGDSGWMVIHAERLWREGQKRPGVLSRLVAGIARRFVRRRG